MENLTKEQQISMIKKDCNNIELIKNPHQETCLEAMRQNPDALKHFDFEIIKGADLSEFLFRTKNLNTANLTKIIKTKFNETKNYNLVNLPCDYLTNIYSKTEVQYIFDVANSSRPVNLILDHYLDLDIFKQIAKTNNNIILFCNKYTPVKYIHEANAAVKYDDF